MTLLLSFVFLFVSASYAGNIPVLAYKDGEIIPGEISAEQYSELLVTTKNALDEKIVENLMHEHAEGADWVLKKFSLGLGLTGEIGVGPWKFGTALKQRFVYSR